MMEDNQINKGMKMKIKKVELTGYAVWFLIGFGILIVIGLIAKIAFKSLMLGWSLF